jgi:hypothetical protein
VRPAALLLALLGLLAACGPVGLAGDLAVGTAQVGLGAAQAAVGVVDLAL